MSKNGKRMTTEECKATYEGKHYITKEGKEIIVIEYKSFKELIVEFVETGVQVTCQLNAILSGSLKYPFLKSCIAFEDNTAKYVNSIFKTNQGYFVRVIGYGGISNITVQFLDTGYTCSVTAQNLQNGEIRNPFHKNIFGGYLGVGPYNGDEFKWLYQAWYNMLMRSSETNYYEKYRHGVTAYEGVSVCEEWKNYNVFADWYMGILSQLNPHIVYEVDKDLLTKYNGLPKMYSPRNCILLPHDLNTLIQTRVSKRSFNNYNNPFHIYKAKKEKEVREMAEQYYRAGSLPEIAYKILSKYTLNYEDLDD